MLNRLFRLIYESSEITHEEKEALINWSFSFS